MFRIDAMSSGTVAVLELSGDLTSPYVSVLLDACRRHSRPLVLSLAGLTGADEHGVAALRILVAFGVAIESASPYFRYLLATR